MSLLREIASEIIPALKQSIKFFFDGLMSLVNPQSD